ncbi:MAG: inositol monophosphatase family protein [Candidatus Woesearchaeota archaeon]
MKQEELFTFMKKIVVKAGKETLKYFGKSKVQYSKNYVDDIVTQADLASSKILIDAIKKKYPLHGIISEEEKDYNPNADYVWIIDPLDGTGNFNREQPLYTILIAFMERKKIICGAIYVPYLDILYSAMLAEGAYKNGRRIFCSKEKNLDKKTGAGALMIHGPRKNKVEKFSKSSQKYLFWTLESGSVAYDAMQVAEGKIHWHFFPPFMLSGGIWDTAASYIILKESGCNVTNFDGKEWTIDDKTEMIAANPDIHKQIMEIIK